MILINRSFPKFSKVCQAGVFEKTIIVDKSQVDAFGRMKISDLARQMEKITEAHLDSFGMSRDALLMAGKIWVIAWNDIDIRRLPRQGDSVILRTWQCKKKTTIFPRKYAFYSINGENLVCAASLFVLMDHKTRNFVEPTEQLKIIPIVEVPGEPDIPKMSIPFPDILSESKVRVIQPEEIDDNGHVNNTYYLDWAEELGNINKQEPKRIWIRYSRELLEGHEVILQHQSQGNQLFVIGYSEGESFSMMVECQKSFDSCGEKDIFVNRGSNNDSRDRC